MIPGTGLIGWASRLVPFTRREAWRREWEAEVAYSWRQLGRGGAPSALARMRLRMRVATCVIDALWERKETMRTSGLLGDLRHALRGLRRQPTFTAIVILTLALGIGVNTAVFTIVEGVVIKPLPFGEPDELVSMRHQGRDGHDELPMSTGLYLVYAERVPSLEAIGLWYNSAVNFVADGEPRRVDYQAVTPSFFDVLGVEPQLGRTFVESEGLPDGERVVVLSDGFWRSAFGADPSVIGRSVDINGTSREVVGVMPPRFGYPDRDARLWLPYVIDPSQAPLASFGANGIGRLADGHTIEGLRGEVANLISRLEELFPEGGQAQFLTMVNLRGVVEPLKDQLVGDVSQTLWVLLGTVGFVLLIACANVANLLLVRTEGRHRELALRVAVGAGRMDVLRAFLSESVVLATLGGVLGTAIAAAAVRVAIRLAPPGLPRVDDIGVDATVLGFTAAISLGCALFFGVFPLLRYGSDDLAAQLKEDARHGATGGRGAQRVRGALVVTQVALALVLLVGSGLMLRSFAALRAVDPGFDAEGVLTARLAVPSGEIEGWEETAGFYRQLRDRLAEQPGVLAAGFAQSAPLSSGLSYFSIEVEDHPRGDDEVPIICYNDQVEAGYFEAMGIDLVEGRTFERGDGAEGARSVVVSQAFAEMYWPNESALGRRVRLGFTGEGWYNIVGVVRDAHYRGLQLPAEDMVYWPATVGPADDPQPTRTMYVTLKTATDPAGFIPVLRREVAALNPRIPISEPGPFEDVVESAMASASFSMTMLASAAGIALVLGLVGIYGVISYVVSQRTREIGVRMALGASAPTVRGMVVREGMALAVGGVILGLLGAWGLSRLMASLLFGVTPTDPATYGTVAAAMVAVALAASWIPATRAARVDPASALRAD